MKVSDTSPGRLWTPREAGAAPGSDGVRDTQDKVTLGEGSGLLSLVSAIRGGRSERLKALRARIAAGSYKPDAESVARALLDEARWPLGGGDE